jgi:membrane-bound ClpP family serine protease
VKLVYLIAILASIALIALIIVIALYHHKKSVAGEVLLLGRCCEVNTSLTPEGTVLVQGELWRARSVDETSILAPTSVRIVGTKNYWLVVKAID